MGTPIARLLAESHREIDTQGTKLWPTSEHSDGDILWYVDQTELTSFGSSLIRVDRGRRRTR